MKKNVLNIDQVFEVARFLGTIEEKLKGEGPGLNIVAEWATKAVGFPVSGTNVKTAARAAHITWECKRGVQGGAVLKGLAAKVESLTLRLTQAEADVCQLRGLVHHLYQQLGASPPKELKIPVTQAAKVSAS